MLVEVLVVVAVVVVVMLVVNEVLLSSKLGRVEFRGPLKRF